LKLTLRRVLIFLLILVFLASAILLTHTGARLYRRRAEAHLAEPRRSVPWQVQFYTILDALADPPIILSVILSIVGFIVL
jgi:hypothetical protein